MSRCFKSVEGSSEKYSAPSVSVVVLEVESVLCQSMNFGQNGGAGSDLLGDDIIDGGEF